MKKEFIPYQQALALKELGFDEICFATFNMDKKVSRNPSHNMEDLPIEGQPYYWNNSKIHKDSVTAPLKQQAFRWFRTELGLKHDIQDDRKGEKFYYAITSYTPKFDQYDDVLFHIRKEVDWHEIEFKSYEEAELACLIKLIEIVKNKTL